MSSSENLVFLIDDDASVRKGVSRLLRSAGYTNEVFASAAEFLLRERYPGPCCLVLDIRMPGLNGMDLQTTLIQRRREEQLVFITGHGDIAMCAEAMKAGAVDFLPKPFPKKKLLQCVDRALLSFSRAAKAPPGKRESTTAARSPDPARVRGHAARNYRDVEQTDRS